MLDRIDAQNRLSVTFDRSKEMARHEQLSERTGVKAYFADPTPPGSAAPTKTPTD